MDSSRPSRRGYTESEVGALMQRATELHDRATGESDRRLSLAEVEQLAAELGVPPEHLRAAAVEMAGKEVERRGPGLLGGPFVISETRLSDGSSGDESWEHIVMEMRRLSGHTGTTTAVGRSREWAHFLGEGDQGANLSKTRVTMRPEGEQTAIQIRKHFPGVAFWYLPVLVTSVLLAMAGLNAFENELALGLGAAGVLGSLAAVRALIGTYARRQKAKLGEWADRLQGAVSVPEMQALPADNAADLLEIPELEPEEEEATRVRRGRRL
jgi:hypothetical protein